MATLKIFIDTGFIGWFRTYHIFLDGIKISEIPNNESKEFSIAQGQHEVIVKRKSFESKPLQFSATAGEEVTFRVKSILRGLRLLLFILIPYYVPISRYWLDLERIE